MSRRVLRRIGRLFTATGDGVLTAAAVALESGTIAWVGPDAGADAWLAGAGGDRDEWDVEDCAGALVTPGLVDAHTHPLYAGSRFGEIAARSAGASYLEVAAAGGGIASTVRATRAASSTELLVDLETRLGDWLAGGTTTVEAKTGYHLDLPGETGAVALLAACAGGGGVLPRLEVTFLGAHAVPPERAGDQAGYVEEVVSWCKPAAEAGARHCDVFCDEGYFTVDESRRILLAARDAGLLPRLHADELARTGGAQLAAEVGAASADHLLRITDVDAKALAAAGVVATLAPTTALSMGRLPPARALLDAGATIALGTDHNPGTCGTTSMSLVVALAVTGLGLSVDEALTAATAGGAASLRRPDRGRVAPGMLADLVCWDAGHEGAFAWSFGLRPTHVWLGGEAVHPAP
jgi:imidazolonepropionase